MSAVAAAIVIPVTAQHIDYSKVPGPVKNAFAAGYPGQPAKWEKEKGQFEAGFRKAGNNISVLFMPDGTVVETEIEIKVEALPGAVLDYVKTHYKAAVIKEAAKITKADGSLQYEAAVNGTDLIFDE